VGELYIYDNDALCQDDAEAFAESLLESDEDTWVYDNEGECE
jgi:hypothetical protein